MEDFPLYRKYTNWNLKNPQYSFYNKISFEITHGKAFLPQFFFSDLTFLNVTFQITAKKNDREIFQKEDLMHQGLEVMAPF